MISVNQLLNIKNYYIKRIGLNMKNFRLKTLLLVCVAGVLFSSQPSEARRVHATQGLRLPLMSFEQAAGILLPILARMDTIDSESDVIDFIASKVLIPVERWTALMDIKVPSNGILAVHFRFNDVPAYDEPFSMLMWLSGRIFSHKFVYSNC